MIKNADSGHLMIVISFKEMSMQIDFSDKYYSPVFYALKKKNAFPQQFVPHFPSLRLAILLTFLIFLLKKTFNSIYSHGSMAGREAMKEKYSLLVVLLFTIQEYSNI